MLYYNCNYKSQEKAWILVQKMKKISKNTTKKIAFVGVMVALTTIFSFVPISFGPVTLALMIIPLLVTALCQDFLTTFVVGCFVGGINILAWYTTKAASPVAPIFQNPIVCIAPKIVLGIASWGIYNLVRVIVKKSKKDLSGTALVSIDTAASVVATAFAVVIHTGLVSAFTLLFFSGKNLSGTAIDVNFILGWFGLNFVIEVVSFSLLVPPIAAALKKARLVENSFYIKSASQKKVEDEAFSTKEDAID